MSFYFKSASMNLSHDWRQTFHINQCVTKRDHNRSLTKTSN